jgi:radical SAM superfamily enzyme YgiQ (UPF0313 family)
MGYEALLVHPLYSKMQDINENIGIGYIASYSRAKGKEVEMLDIAARGWTQKEAVDYICGDPPALIGISILFQEGAAEALDFARELRDGGVRSHITIGGIYPSFEYENLLNNHPEIDSVCIGEGEETFYFLLESIESGTDAFGVEGLALRKDCQIITTPRRAPLMDLDTLPFPARDVLPSTLKHRTYASIVSSRGCYGRCSFCSVSGFFSSIGARYRYRNPGRVADEIEGLVGEFGVTRFTFDDANFLGGRAGVERALDFARILTERGLQIEYSIQCRCDSIERELFKTLKASGLARVYLGVESASQPQLDRYKKGIEVEQVLRALEILADLGIFVQMGFIMFDPYATVDDISANQQFLAKAKTMFPEDKLGYLSPTTKLIPLSGSEYMEKLKDEGHLKGDYLGYTYNFADKKTALLYNISSASANVLWGAKRFFKDKSSGEEGFPRHWSKAQGD